MWIKEDSCASVVKSAWEKGECSGSTTTLSRCLDECRSALKLWNKNCFGHVGKQIATLQNKLESLECQNRSPMAMEELQNTRDELNKLLDLEETMWQQRSCINQLKSRDKNTSFFHTKASSRFQRNTILRVMDETRVWRGEDEESGRTFVSYFKKRFSSSKLEVNEKLINVIHGKDLEQSNFLLTQEFQVDEVERALKQMFPTTAPSLDGMPPPYSTRNFGPL